MARYVVIIGVLVVVGAAVFLLDHARNAYKILPANIEAPEEPSPYSMWYNFEPENGKFSAQLPVPPQNAKESVAIPGSTGKRTYDMYVSQELDNTIYLISVITYPKTEKKGILREIVTEMVQTNPNNTLDSVEETSFQGKPALMYDLSNNNLQIKGVTFADGNEIFVLSTIMQKNNLKKEDYQHFLDSFHLNQKEAA